MNRYFASMLLGLSAVVAQSQEHAAITEGTTVDGRYWRIERAAAFDNGLPATRKQDSILVLEDPERQKPAPAPYVSLLVQERYDKVQPMVRQALDALGKFDFSSGSDDLGRWGWDQVLLSRRPDLRESLAEISVGARLRLAVERGEITPAERERRFAEAGTRLDSTERGRLPALRATYPSFTATQRRSFGLAGRQHSELEVSVHDVTAVFGHPATAVEIGRGETYPNLKDTIANQWRAFPLGTPPPPMRYDANVPAGVFQAIHAALVATGGRVEIGQSLDWMQPVAWPVSAPPLSPVAANPDAPSIEPQAIDWDAMANDTRDRGFSRYQLALLALPDGDLMLREGDWRTMRVWRLHESDGEWRAEYVWQGGSMQKDLALSADGRVVWFDENVTEGGEKRLHAYHVETRRLVTHAVEWPDGSPPDHSIWSRWLLAGDQLPVLFEDVQRSTHRFDVLRSPATAPSETGSWPLRLMFSSLRPSSIRSVLWREPNHFWIEDKWGIAELDATDGRVLRTWMLPGCSDAPECDVFTGSPHVAFPLGSPEAGWIAVGFVARLVIQDTGPPVPADSKTGQGGNSRLFAGMHVIRTRDGRVLSALLGETNVVAAAARSANGRLLAFGTDRSIPAEQGRQVVLWDVDNAGTPVRLTVPSGAHLNALAFSWDGADLWALSDRGLLRWRLPASLRDAARGKAFPEQSVRR